MPRIKKIWNEEKYKRYLKEGRGKGQGKDYIPWIKTREFASSGRRSRSPGWKTGRLHHMMSDNETRYFYLLEWAKNVIDIREQFPLSDLEMVQTIASDMGVKYPIDKKSKFPFVLTSDFLITIQHKGSQKDIVRTIKPANQLSRKRVIEKFEIERRYWLAKKVDWGIVTPKETPNILAKNIENIHSDYYLEPIGDKSVEQLYGITEILKQRLEMSKKRISNITSSIDNELNLEGGTCLKIFRHLLARKEVLIDMNKKISFAKSTKSILHINPYRDKGRRVA